MQATGEGISLGLTRINFEYVKVVVCEGTGVVKRLG